MLPRRPLHRLRRREAGTILALVMISFVILIVVAVQLTFSANVEREHAHMAVISERMDLLAQAAVRQAESVLLLDVEDAGAGEEQGGGGALGGGGAGGAGSDSAADVVANTDSNLDEWSNASALMPSMGDGLQLYVEVVDEDSKFNLLSIFAEDEELQEEAREIFGRLLDVAFEGTEYDIGFGDASDLVDRLEQWAQGDRGSSHAVPLPSLKKTNAQEEDELLSLDTAIFDDNEGHYPLSLGELLQVGGLEPAHMDGFVEADVYHPGLHDLLTLYSHLELKTEPEEDDAFSGSPFGGASGTSGFGSTGVGGGPEEQPTITAESTNTGLINLNTASLTVLRAVARDYVPLSALELLVEFRDKIEEAEENSLLGGGDSLFGGNDDSGSGSSDSSADSGGDGSDDGGEEVGEDDEDDPSKFVFSDPAQAFQMIEGEFQVTINADDTQRDEFLKWFWVESQVFTVKVMIRDPATGLRRHYRSMLWRMMGSDRPRMVTLRPVETCQDSRRLDDFPGDLEETSEDRLFSPR